MAASPSDINSWVQSYGGPQLRTFDKTINAVSYTHLRAHETPEHRVCRRML